ncbi:glycerol-3-phosphate dehydrogenase/oxidase [Bordetella hinzii]|uniref:glycerol-3-phosphate dehydrogenase/oxidase n=1 Tax=Bordetella hinzii TaxID=103855 RepID=UPI00115235D0|nr:FAD-dependent oxidoreductase [Bordetella hinzii]
MNPSTPDAMPLRADLLARLETSEPWDVVIIGGGATGLGTAVDAASRGFRTLLIEGADFAKGTSSKATKLVHGGVRYLAQGNISLVREALHERGLLNRNAPHLAWPLGFVVPAYSLLDQPFYGVGLKMYDMLAGALNLAPSRWLSRDETLAHARTLAPAVKGKRLRGGVLYYDGQFDDARLAISLMRTLFDQGGTAINYVRVTGLSRDAQGRVDGVQTEDVIGGARHAIRGKCIVNATGVWVDAVRRMDDPAAQTMVAPSQGVHLTLPRDFLPGDEAILVPKTDDGRVLFMVPWNGHTIVGTTDTARQDLPADPRPLPGEVEFILETAGRYLTRQPTRADVTSVWAGLRPLVKATGEASTKSLSREHTILVSKSGLITVTGGKWTTYRKMAQDVVDTAIEKQLLPQAACRSADLRLHGAPAPGTRLAEPQGTPDSYYGTDLPALRALPGADRMLVKASGLTEAHVRYAARHEMARTVEDVLARRNRALFLDAEAAQLAAPEVARLLAQELGHDAAWQQRTLADFEAVAATFRLPA